MFVNVISGFYVGGCSAPQFGTKLHLVLCLQILALRLLQAVLPSWDKMERSQDMKFLVEKLFSFLGSLLSTCSSDLPLLRGTSAPATLYLLLDL